MGRAPLIIKVIKEPVKMEKKEESVVSLGKKNTIYGGEKTMTHEGYKGVVQNPPKTIGADKSICNGM